MARNAILQLRVDEREKSRWRRIAGADDRPLSDWVREACARHTLMAGGVRSEDALAQMRRLANRLAIVTTPNDAAELAAELRGLIEENWS